MLIASDGSAYQKARVFMLCCRYSLFAEAGGYSYTTTMLYTRKGDDGTSGLFGSKERLPKDCPLFEALGTVDELNSLLGVCFAKANEKNYTNIAELLRSVQQDLFIVQAELAGADKKLDQPHVEKLEAAIAELEQKFDNPQSFVIAGGSELSALLDYARAVSRRAEREAIAMRSTNDASDTAGTVTIQKPLSAETRQYLNRLSSFLYALARFANTLASSAEQKPTY